MSSGRQATYDDEREWEDIQRVHNLPRHWQVYSDEARLAVQARNLGISKASIISYVQLAMQIQKLIEAAEAETKEYKLYLQLKERYGSKAS